MVRVRACSRPPEYSEANNTHVWAIGVDSDQYLIAEPDQQTYILTSMLKQVDVAVFDTIKAAPRATPRAASTPST